jgi:hypothetical protein
MAAHTSPELVLDPPSHQRVHRTKAHDALRLVYFSLMEAERRQTKDDQENANCCAGVGLSPLIV